jgi:CBS domain-containing protein
VGRVLGFVLIALGFLEVVAGSFLGLWLAFVGWFIVAAATAEGQLDQAEGLTGLQVGDVMEPAPTVLAEWWTVEQVLAQASRDDQPVARAFPLADFAGHAAGALALRDLERVPVGRRAETRLRDIVRSRRRQPLLTRREALVTKIAGQLRQRGSIAIVVDEDNRPIGLLTADDLARVARSVERDRRKSASLSI